MIGFFVLMGKAMEDRARRKSISDVDRLVRLRPRKVWKVKSDGAPEEVLLGTINVGDLIYLRPGDMLALDGIVSEGSGSFDESVITGESLPVVRQLHDLVPSGAVNAGSTAMTIKITRVGQDTTIEQIIRLIEDARLSKPPIQVLADRVAAVFVPVVMSLALATFLFWCLTGRREMNESLMIGLSVLVVACPCALGLATPVAWVAGLGRAARAGVLVRSYDALEALRKANTIIFDKTGTLTYGKPTVTRVIDGSGNSMADKPSIRDVMAKTISVLAHSSHPISRSVSIWIKENYDVSKAPLSKLIAETAGLGVRCEIKSEHKEVVLYGRPDFVVKDVPSAWQVALKSGHPLMAVSFDGEPVLLFELNDEIRSDAGRSLAKLNHRGIAIHIASGDKDTVVAELAKKLPEVASFKGQMSPLSKKDMVESLRKEGHIVAFVGDGINDAPALAAADVGISLGTGTDIAAQSAGLVLQKPGVDTLIDAIDLSSRITKIIRENFFWAFFYNVAAIPVAMAGLVTPMWAAAAMAMSSLSVVLNALRLRR
jgi:Cu+-exporting ATPase